MKFLQLLFAVILVLLVVQSPSIAGQIGNLNINASNGAKVNVNSSKGSTINKTNVKKDSNSSVIINGKEVNCNEDDIKKGICKPENY